MRPELVTFHSYARRIKHITHRRGIPVHSHVLTLLMSEIGNPMLKDIGVLSSLATVQISSSSCDTVQASLTLSARLQHLDLDLGFKTRVATTMGDAACQYLEDVARIASTLQRLSLRGIASKRLSSVISSMSGLHSLSLRLGTSLTAEAFTAITTFPSLSELEVHAGHFDLDDLASVWSRHAQGATTFPSLQILHVRAHTPVVEHLLQHIQSNALRVLHIEAENPADSPISWCPIFRTICDKATYTLQDLTIDHHVELDSNIPNHSPSTGFNPDPDINPPPDAEKTDNVISFKALEILRGLHHLRSLVLDTTFPPELCDKDMEALTQWWPKLEHLELGSVPVPDSAGLQGSPQITCASLATLAKYTPKLRSLVLSVDLTGYKDESLLPDPASQSALRRLIVGCSCTFDSAQMAHYLHRLFPSLSEVDGVAEQEDQWLSTAEVLRML